MGALVAWFFAGLPPRITEEMIATGKRVNARVVSGHLNVHARAASTATVRLEIPRTFGITSCESTLTVGEFERSRGGEVPVTVIGGPVPQCLTGTAYRMMDPDNIGGVTVAPMLFGAMLAWLLYYPIIRMEWSSAGSLKARWDAERAQSAAPTPT